MSKLSEDEAFRLANNKIPKGAVIKVIGVGGCGGNAVNYMMAQTIEGVEFICANTDAKALADSQATRIQLGADLTKGSGAGGDPEVGYDAAKENAEQIRQSLEGADMVFITAGMGGGTGSGASPVIAEIAKELGALTIAVVTKPFENVRRQYAIAERSIEQLSGHVDSLIILANEKLLSVFGASEGFDSAMAKAHDVLYGAVQGIAEVITRKGSVNMDFADIRSVMSETGRAMIGSGSAEGEGRAKEAMAAAIQNPLLEDMDLNNVRGLLVNITSANISMGEYNEISDSFRDIAADDAHFKVGVVTDEAMGDKIRITVVATGIDTALADESLSNVVALDGEKPPLKTLAGENGASEGSVQHDESPPQDDGKYNQLTDIPALMRKQID